jgi:hypothetical protein
MRVQLHEILENDSLFGAGDYDFDRGHGPYFAGCPPPRQSLCIYMAGLQRKRETDAAQPAYFLTETGVRYRLIDEQPPLD